MVVIGKINIFFGLSILLGSILIACWPLMNYLAESNFLFDFYLTVTEKEGCLRESFTKRLKSFGLIYDLFGKTSCRNIYLPFHCYYTCNFCAI